MRPVWNTKFGWRRVRHDPPTIAEAVFAARGLTDDTQQQIEIAASLMGLTPDEVRPEVLKAGAKSRTSTTVAFTSRAGGQRAVVVERRPSRRSFAAR